MMKFIKISILIILLSSCSKNQNRVIYYYDLDALKNKDYCELTTITKDNVINYEYNFIEKKKITCSFNLDSKTLIFDNMKFKIIEKNKFSIMTNSKYSFDLFHPIEPEEDAYGPMLFNSDFGLLNIDNGDGTKIIFLESLDNLEIGKKIILELYKK